MGSPLKLSAFLFHLFFQFPIDDFADEGLWQHRSKFQLLVNRVLRNMLLTIC